MIWQIEGIIFVSRQQSIKIKWTPPSSYVQHMYSHPTNYHRKKIKRWQSQEGNQPSIPYRYELINTYILKIKPDLKICHWEILNSNSDTSCKIYPRRRFFLYPCWRGYARCIIWHKVRCIVRASGIWLAVFILSRAGVILFLISNYSIPLYSNSP